MVLAVAGIAAATYAGLASNAVAAPPTAVVEMTNDLRFTPDTVRIALGGSVEWRNTSDLVHTVTADPKKAIEPEHVQLPSGVAAFDSGNLGPGARFTRAFDVLGTYRYFCVPHEVAGMVGTVIVSVR
ncbi:MAG: plastocyanin/azurin family copper-binding protein [Gemmatimonadales bacterium]